MFAAKVCIVEKWPLPDVFVGGKLHIGVQTGQCTPQ
jgi:hypothetical protein